MFSLNQSILVRGAAGEPLKNPFTGLSKLEVEFRRGDFSVVCAGGGTGKSLTALWLAVWSNVPTLYFSADSTAATQLSRATAMITGDGARDIKRKLVANDGSFAEYEAALSKRWWLRFNYAARPTPKEIELHLECYREVFGIYPHLVIVDNITNVDGEGPRTQRSTPSASKGSVTTSMRWRGRRDLTSWPCITSSVNTAPASSPSRSMA